MLGDMAIRWAGETERMLAAQTQGQKLSLLQKFLAAWHCPDVPEGQFGAISAQRQIITVVMDPGSQCDDLPNLLLLALCEARSRFESISPIMACRPSCDLASPGCKVLRRTARADLRKLLL